MGVDIQTYRGRIGSFSRYRGTDAKIVKCVLNLSLGLETIGALIFVSILLLVAGIEPNPGPITGTGGKATNSVAQVGFNYLSSSFKGTKDTISRFVCAVLGNDNSSTTTIEKPGSSNSQMTTEDNQRYESKDMSTQGKGDSGANKKRPFDRNEDKHDLDKLDEPFDTDETDKETKKMGNKTSTTIPKSASIPDILQKPKRFKSASDKQINLLKAQSTEITTDSKTRWAVKLIKDWMLEAGYSHTDFEWLPVEELNMLLERFYASVQTKSGDNYSKSALVGLRAGLNRYLTLPPVGRMINLKDRQFQGSNQVFTGLVKALKREGKDISCHKEPIDENDIHKLYTSGVFNLDKPETLQNKVLFDIMSRFGRRGVEGLRNLRKYSFILCYDAKSRKYIKMAYNEADKTHHGLDCKEKSKEPRMYACEDQFCPVTSFELYLSKLNPNCSYLFQKPLQKVSSTCQIWYAAKPLGVKTLSNFMPKVSLEAGLSRRYTNRCIRAYISTKLVEKGFSNRSIMSVTGHRNESSHTSSDDKRAAVSNALVSSTIVSKAENKVSCYPDSHDMPKQNKMCSPSTSTFPKTVDINMLEQSAAVNLFTGNIANSSITVNMYSKSN